MAARLQVIVRTKKEIGMTELPQRVREEAEKAGVDVSKSLVITYKVILDLKLVNTRIE